MFEWFQENTGAIGKQLKRNDLPFNKANTKHPIEPQGLKRITRGRYERFRSRQFSHLSPFLSGRTSSVSQIRSMSKSSPASSAIPSSFRSVNQRPFRIPSNEPNLNDAYNTP